MRRPWSLTITYFIDIDMKPKEFYELLERHDWWYEQSDDGAVYRKGRNERHRLQAIVQENDTLAGLYKRYTDFVFRGDDKPDTPEE